MVIEPKELCIGLPKEFFLIMEYVRNTHYSGDVDYDFIQDNLESIIYSKGSTNDKIFDWHS